MKQSAFESRAQLRNSIRERSVRDGTRRRRKESRCEMRKRSRNLVGGDRSLFMDVSGPPWGEESGRMRLCGRQIVRANTPELIKKLSLRLILSWRTNGVWDATLVAALRRLDRPRPPPFPVSP